MSTDSLENIRPGDMLFVEASERSRISRVERVTKTLIFMEDHACFSRKDGYLARNSAIYCRAYIRPVRPDDEERLAAERRHRELWERMKKLSPCDLTDEQMERILAIAGGEPIPAPQWIPVEERLPEEYRTVLAYIDSDDFRELRIALAHWSGEDWYTRGCHIRPSHWLPIPPLNPEKEER